MHALLPVTVLALVATSCKPGIEPGKIDCDTEIEYQGRVVEGQVSAGKFAAQGKTEIAAVRQIDEVVERYLTRWRGMCREYNAGIYSKDEYRVESRSLREKMEQLDAMLMQLANAPDSEAYQAALSGMYQKIVPDTERTTLEIQFSVRAQKPDASEPITIRGGEQLPTGSKLSFTFQTSQTAYVYLYQESPSGQISVLFPFAQIKLQNPLPASTNLEIPPPPGTFRLNAEDIGKETVHIVASKQPLSQLEAVLKGESISVAEAECSSRGLEYDAGTPDECAGSRGLEYDSGTSTSLSAMTELGGDRIIQVFSFEHVP